MQATFNHAKLTHLITIVPQNRINIDDELNTRYQGDIKKLNRVKKEVGLQYHYESDEGIIASDLGEYGAKMLFDEFNIDKDSLDAIVVCTQTPDFFVPPTACYLHGKLNLSEKTLAFDINQSCAGYVYALYVLFSMIESGNCKRILLICGDTSSKFYRSLNSVNIGGDAVSVSLVEYDSPPPLENKIKKSYFDLGTDGKGVKYLFMPFGAFRNGIPKCFDNPIFQNKKFEEKQSYMNGLEIFNFAIRKEPSAFMQLLQYANFKKEDLDFVFFHQANKNIVANISRRLNLDEKIAPNDTITKYGNLNACSIPATICDTLNTCKQPLKKNLKVVLGSFGAGLSWANALITLDTNFKCKEVQIYQKERE